MKFGLLYYSPLARMLTDMTEDMNHLMLRNEPAQLMARRANPYYAIRRHPTDVLIDRRRQELRQLSLMRELERQFDEIFEGVGGSTPDSSGAKKMKPHTAPESSSEGEAPSSATQPTAEARNVKLETESATASASSSTIPEAVVPPTPPAEVPAEVPSATATRSGRAGYKYSSSKTTTIQDGQTRTEISKHFNDVDGREKCYTERRIETPEGDAIVMSVLKDGDTATTTLEGVEEDEDFEALWTNKAALPSAKEEQKTQAIDDPAPKESDLEVAAPTAK